MARRALAFGRRCTPGADPLRKQRPATERNRLEPGQRAAQLPQLVAIAGRPAADQRQRYLALWRLALDRATAPGSDGVERRRAHAEQHPPTLNQGNPDLQPRRSQNLDLGHDWTFDDGGSLLSIALFHKTIDDEIFRYGQLQTIDGQQVLVTQPRNTDRPVRMRGAELGAIKELGPWLPALAGLSVGANITFLDVQYPVVLGDGSRTTLSVLPQQPKQLWNLTLNYARGPLRSTLAWSRTGELWDDRYPNYSNQQEFYRNRYQQPLDRLDLKLAWDLSPAVAVSLDVLNLAGQGYEYHIGRHQEYVQSAWKMAPTVMLGINVKL